MQLAEHTLFRKALPVALTVVAVVLAIAYLHDRPWFIGTVDWFVRVFGIHRGVAVFQVTVLVGLFTAVGLGAVLTIVGTVIDAVKGDRSSPR